MTNSHFIELKQHELAEIKGSSIEPLKEADLSGHLENGNKDKEAEKDDEEQSLSTKDSQLYEALNILKGMSLLSRK